MNRHWQQVLAELGETRKLIDGIERRMEKVEVILMVREPSSAVAADAYEGLRKQVVGAVTERWTHLAQLAQMDSALAYRADSATLRALVDDWLGQASLLRVTDPDRPDADLLFQVVEDLGGPWEVLRPAYQDATTGRIIQRGQARRRGVRPHGQAPDGGASAAAGSARARQERAEYSDLDRQGTGAAADGGRP